MLLKIIFVIFSVNTNLELENNLLDLVPDSEFSMSKGIEPNIPKQIDNLKLRYQNCFKLYGIKKSSFNKCVGKKYYKVNRELQLLLRQTEIGLKESFSESLEPICEDQKLLCYELIETLGDGVLLGHSPIEKMQEISDNYPLKVKNERLLQNSLDDCIKQYKEYLNIKQRMDNTRDEIIDNVRLLIKQSNIKVHYKYDYNPYQEENDVITNVKFPEKINSNFTHNLLTQIPKNYIQNYQERTIERNGKNVII